MISAAPLRPHTFRSLLLTPKCLCWTRIPTFDGSDSFDHGDAMPTDGSDLLGFPASVVERIGPLLRTRWPRTARPRMGYVTHPVFPKTLFLVWQFWPGLNCQMTGASHILLTQSFGRGVIGRGIWGFWVWAEGFRCFELGERMRQGRRFWKLEEKDELGHQFEARGHKENP